MGQRTGHPRRTQFEKRAAPLDLSLTGEEAEVPTYRCQFSGYSATRISDLCEVSQPAADLGALLGGNLCEILDLEEVTELFEVLAVGAESFRAQVPLCFEVLEERVHRIRTHFHPKGRRFPCSDPTKAEKKWEEELPTDSKWFSHRRWISRNTATRMWITIGKVALDRPPGEGSCLSENPVATTEQFPHDGAEMIPGQFFFIDMSGGVEGRGGIASHRHQLLQQRRQVGTIVEDAMFFIVADYHQGSLVGVSERRVRNHHGLFLLYRSWSSLSFSSHGEGREPKPQGGSLGSSVMTHLSADGANFCSTISR